MRYPCKLCNGRGKQKNSLTCNCCKGRGCFDITGKVAKQCRSCKGTGRATIRTLPCISCGGKGFSVLSEATEIKTLKKEEPKMPKMETMPAASVTKKSGKKIEEEFGEEHLDSLKEKLTEILESPY